METGNEFQVAVNCYKNCEYEKSLKIFDKAISVNGSNHIFENSRSLVFNLKKYRDMIEYIDQILKINPNDSKFLTRKGCLFEILFEHNKALVCLDKALESDPENYLAICYKGIVFYNLERFEEAILYFDKILSVNPTDPEASLGKGLSLEMIGEKEKALSILVNAFQFDLTRTEILHSICFNLIWFCFPTTISDYAKNVLEIDSKDPIANKTLELVKPNENKIQGKIAALYDKYLHREPSVEEIRHWEEVILEGKSIPWIEEQIKNSEEGRNYFN